MAKEAAYSVVFHGNGAVFHWTVVEGHRHTGRVLMTSREFDTYQEMRDACVSMLKSIQADDMESFDCEEKEKVKAKGLRSKVLTVSKVGVAAPKWHVITHSNWLLQMDCEVCPCRKGETVEVSGKLVTVGKRRFTVKKKHVSSKQGFTVYVVKEVK